MILKKGESDKRQGADSIPMNRSFQNYLDCYVSKESALAVRVLRIGLVLMRFSCSFTAKPLLHVAISSAYGTRLFQSGTHEDGA